MHKCIEGIKSVTSRFRVTAGAATADDHFPFLGGKITFLAPKRPKNEYFFISFFDIPQILASARVQNPDIIQS